MAGVKYEIVEHDGGWAYRVQDTYSETFRSHAEALQAAKRAAAEQQVPGEDSEIEWEDEHGQWHDEHSPGGERPATEISDQQQGAKSGRRR